MEAWTVGLLLGVVILIVLFVVWMAKNLMRSRTGRAMASVTVSRSSARREWQAVAGQPAVSPGS
jgi:flagellar biogenesis protein FliO